MTTYYCIKSTGEVIGTHYEGWLALRDNDPAQYEALRNSRDLQLVRVGYYRRDAIETIKQYGLLDEHKRLCAEYMQRRLSEVTKEVETLEDDLTFSISPAARYLIESELEKLRNQRDTYTRDIARGALHLSSCEDD